MSLETELFAQGQILYNPQVSRLSHTRTFLPQPASQPAHPPTSGSSSVTSFWRASSTSLSASVAASITTAAPARGVGRAPAAAAGVRQLTNYNRKLLPFKTHSALCAAGPAGSASFALCLAFPGAGRQEHTEQGHHAPYSPVAGVGAGAAAPRQGVPASALLGGMGEKVTASVSWSPNRLRSAECTAAVAEGQQRWCEESSPKRRRCGS